MAVFRVEKSRGYTVMSNHHLRNKELSLKAKGLLSQMLSLPEDWDYTLAGLSHINRESIDAIRTAVWELENAGYITRRQGRDEKGKMAAIEYTIYEQPQPPSLENPILENPTTDKPVLENPTTDNPTSDNPTQINKEEQRTDLPKKEKSNTDLSNTHSIPILFPNSSPLGDDAAEPQERKRKEATAQSALTIKDMTALLAPAYSEWDNHIYKQYLERFSLQQEQTIGTLSKGMKMKYALALALSHNAELLIMDEPTSGLDPLMREQFINILKSYIEPGGRAVFYSTHNTTDLDKSADMLIMINAGKILFEEEKDFLLEKFRVVKGDVKYLSPDIKSLMLHFEKSKYGFTGISDNASKIKFLYPDVLFERASIEDIMLAYVKEGE